MRVSPACVGCLLKRVAYEAGLVDPAKVPVAVRAARSVLARRFRPERVSARLATEVHRAVYRALGTRDPYREVKEQSNAVALELFPRAEALVARSRDRLRTAALCSIAGNILDFGIRTDVRGPEALRERFDLMVNEGLAVNDLPRLRRRLKPGAEVLYLADNCGEIILDRLVLRELRRMGASTTLVVKGEPILTDATHEEVERFGLAEEVDGVLDTGTFAVGIDLERAPAGLRRALRESDVIVSKGMANFESLSGSRLRPIAHLLRTKCGPVASAAGAPLDRNIAKLWE